MCIKEKNIFQCKLNKKDVYHIKKIFKRFNNNIQMCMNNGHWKKPLVHQSVIYSFFIFLMLHVMQIKKILNKKSIQYGTDKLNSIYKIWRRKNQTYKWQYKETFGDIFET